MSFIRKLFGQQESTKNNLDLVQAVQAVAQDDNPQTRQSLLSAFVQSTVIVPTVRDGKNALPMLLRDPEGHLALPAFTDLSAISRTLREWGSSESSYNSVQGTDLFSFALQHEVDAIVINLTNSAGVEI